MRGTRRSRAAEVLGGYFDDCSKWLDSEYQEASDNSLVERLTDRGDAGAWLTFSRSRPNWRQNGEMSIAASP